MRTMTLEEKRESLNNVLDSINELDDIVLESDADVLLSMGMTYNKASVILENYDYYDYDEIFAIFQEEDTTATQSSEPTANSDMNAKAAETNQNAKKGFFAFFINIFKKIVQFFKDAWNGRIAPAFENVANKVKGAKIEEEKIPLWKAIFTKSMEWIKEHKTSLGIGAIALAGIEVFKQVLANLEDNNKFKQFMSKLLGAIGAPIDSTKLIFKATILGKPVGKNEEGQLVVLTNVNIGTRIKYILTTGIPNFFKAEAALLGNLKNIANADTEIENTDAFKKAKEELGKLKNPDGTMIYDQDKIMDYINDPNKEIDEQYKDAIASLTTLKDLKDSLDATSNSVNEFQENLKKLGIGGDKDEDFDKFFNGIKEKINKPDIVAKFEKGQKTMGQMFMQTSLIGGIITTFGNIFEGILGFFNKASDGIAKLKGDLKKDSEETQQPETGGGDDSKSETEYEKVEFAADDNDPTNGYVTLNTPEKRKTLYKKGDDGQYTPYGETEELDRNNTYKVKEKADGGSEEFKKNDTFEKVIEESGKWEEILKRDELKNEDMLTLFPQDTLKTAGIEGDELNEFFKYVLAKYNKEKKEQSAPEGKANDSSEEKTEPANEETDKIKKGNSVSGAALLQFLKNNGEYNKSKTSSDGHILDKNGNALNSVSFKPKTIDGESISKGTWNQTEQKYHLEYDVNNIDDNDDIISESWYNKF